MPSETILLAVSDQDYLDVSAGEPIVVVYLKSGQHVRLVVSAVQPAPDTPAYLPRHGPASREPYVADVSQAVSLSDLDPTTRLWCRSETAPLDVLVVRGDAKPVI